MKSSFFFLFLLMSISGFSREITCKNIHKFSLSKVYNSFFNQTITKEEAICMGETLAKHDRKHLKKIILSLHGPFMSGCLECIYHKFGFEVIYIGADDLFDEELQYFMQAYNGQMARELTDGQKIEIDLTTAKSGKVFTSSLIRFPEIKISKTNDSTLHFRLSSDTLEILFQDDMKYLFLEVGLKQNDPEKMIISYHDLKTKGIKLKIIALSDSKLYITYDFSKMPNRYDICWCETLIKSYYIVVPVRW